LNDRRYALVAIQSSVDLGISLFGIVSGVLIVHFGRWPGGECPP
jgi:hypothetical protein